MKFNTIASCCLISLAAAQETIPAKEVTDSVKGAAYKAVLTGGTETEITGAIYIKSGPYGKGVVVHPDFKGFPGFDTSSYTYHIHAKTVPADGNCTSAGPHFDPYRAGANSASPSTYKCDPTKPDYCELGDLAGKHGDITVDPYSEKYQDKYLSTNKDNVAYFGNLSIVVHRKIDNKRLRCGNFELIKRDDDEEGWNDWSAETTKKADPKTTDPWSDWSAETTKKADPKTTDPWSDWSVETTKKADPKPTDPWSDWYTSTTKKVDPKPTKSAEWSEWSAEPTKKVEDPKTTKSAEWSDWSVAPAPVTTTTWYDWSSAAPTTTKVAAVTTVAVYTGGASLMSSGTILSIGGFVTLVMAAFL